MYTGGFSKRFVNILDDYVHIDLIDRNDCWHEEYFLPGLYVFIEEYPDNYYEAWAELIEGPVDIDGSVIDLSEPVGVIPGVLMGGELVLDKSGVVSIHHHRATQKIYADGRVMFNDILQARLSQADYRRVLSAAQMQMRMC